MADTLRFAVRARSGVLLAFALHLGIASASAHARAEPPARSAPGKEHAKKLFDEGLELEKNADYAGALAKYREARQIAVTPGLRFHQGYCLELLGKMASAMDEYEAADALAREQNKQDVHAAVVARLEPLRTRVPHVAIRVAAPTRGVEVQLDGAPVGAPLLDGKAFRVDSGEHTITARAPGHQPFTRVVKTPEAVTTTVDITLERLDHGALAAVAPTAPVASDDASRAETEPPREDSSRRSLVLPIATTAGAVALVATGIVMFAVAGGAASDAERDCPQKASCEDERARVRTFDALALSGFIGAAGLGVLSAYLWTRGRVVATPTSVAMSIEGRW